MARRLPARAGAATLMFVTHDRMFLRKLATRIFEIDRGRLFDWSCDYDTFLVRKEAALAAEEKQNALFDKKLAEEEVWIRTGIKARRTRNEGRVRALEADAPRPQRAPRRRPARCNWRFRTAQRSGMLVAEVDDVSFAYGERPIVRDFSTTIMRGDKIGIIGPNGAGKTTLLRLLLGQLPPQSGTRAPGHESADRLLRPAARSSSTTKPPCRTTSATATTRCASAAARGTSSATCRIFCSRPSGPARRCGFSPAASATACCWRSCSPSRPT